MQKILLRSFRYYEIRHFLVRMTFGTPFVLSNRVKHHYQASEAKYMFFNKTKIRRSTICPTLNIETLELRAMFSVSPVDSDVLTQPNQGPLGTLETIAPIVTSPSLTAVPHVRSICGMPTADGPGISINEHPPTINDIFDRMPLIHGQIETLVPARDYVSDLYANSDVAQEFFDRGVVYGMNSTAVKEAAKLGARGYLAADQGYQNALEHRESQLSKVDGMENVDLNEDGKTGSNDCNNGYDDLKEKGWFGKLCDAISNFFTNNENENDAKITAESEGRYFFQEVPESLAGSASRGSHDMFDAESINVARYDHIHQARYQAFAMMRR